MKFGTKMKHVVMSMCLLQRIFAEDPETNEGGENPSAGGDLSDIKKIVREKFAEAAENTKTNIDTTTTKATQDALDAVRNAPSAEAAVE